MGEKLRKTDVEKLRHMLGVGDHIPRKRWGYRNYFVTDPRSADGEAMQRLVDVGLAAKTRDGNELTGGNAVYRATDVGRAAVGLSAEDTHG